MKKHGGLVLNVEELSVFIEDIAIIVENKKTSKVQFNTV
jgi:hypothetical protein